MGVIDLSSYKPAPSTLGDANQIANGFQAIQNLLNGNVDNNNFGAGLIFDPAKLMQKAAVQGQALAWNGSAWAPAGSMTQIADSVLGASAASFDFQSIPATFAHLRLVLMLRSDPAILNQNNLLRFNNDSGANYDHQYLQMTNSGASISGSAVIAATSLAHLLGLCATGTTANSFSPVVIDIPDYSSAAVKKHMTGLISYNADRSLGNSGLRILAGFWDSTAAINRVQILSAAGNFIAGSRATLYGIG